MTHCAARNAPRAKISRLLAAVRQLKTFARPAKAHRMITNQLRLHESIEWEPGRRSLAALFSKFLRAFSLFRSGHLFLCDDASQRFPNRILRPSNSAALRVNENNAFTPTLKLEAKTIGKDFASLFDYCGVVPPNDQSCR